MRRYLQLVLEILRSVNSVSSFTHAIKIIFKKTWRVFKFRFALATFLRPHRSKIQSYKFRLRAHYNPLVSIIVPNYNHEKYLSERLDSIYRQTYTNYEVILLDDNSSDNSLKILKKYQTSHAGNTKLYPNLVNSGSGYRQWAQGINRSRGELIWIAESDDLAEDNFLEVMVQNFKNRAVALAFCNTKFFTDAPSNPTWDLRSYWNGRTELSTHSNWQITDSEFLAAGMSEENLIPNVSGVLFRRNRLLDSQPEWLNFRFAGDWLFYVTALQGSLVSYDSRVTNFYRSHSESVISLNRYSKDFQNELSNIRSSIKEIQKKIRILVVLPGLVLGGAEIFAFRLAKSLSKYGYIVTLLNSGIVESQESQLYDDESYIPILEPSNQALFFPEFAMQYDILHTHHGSVDFMVSTLNSGKVPQVVSLHGMYELMSAASVARSEKLFKINAPIFTYLVEKNLESFSPGFLKSNKFIRVMNFIPQELVSQKDTWRESQTISAVVISRAIEGKGWLEAVSATEQAREQYGIDARLSLIGSGPISSNFRHISNHAWLSVSGVTEKPMAELIRHDVYLFLSTYSGESMPLILLECLASKVPIIFVASPSTDNLLSDDEGSLGVRIELRESNNISHHAAEALNRFHHMNAEEIKNLVDRGYKKFASHFSESVVINSYLDIYDSLAPNPFQTKGQETGFRKL